MAALQWSRDLSIDVARAQWEEGLRARCPAWWCNWAQRERRCQGPGQGGGASQRSRRESYKSVRSTAFFGKMVCKIENSQKRNGNTAVGIAVLWLLWLLFVHVLVLILGLPHRVFPKMSPTSNCHQHLLCLSSTNLSEIPICRLCKIIVANILHHVSRFMNSLDWLTGKLAGKPISRENLWFTVDFPLHQPIDEYNLHPEVRKTRGLDVQAHPPIDPRAT